MNEMSSKNHTGNNSIHRAVREDEIEYEMGFVREFGWNKVIKVLELTVGGVAANDNGRG